MPGFEQRAAAGRAGELHVVAQGGQAEVEARCRHRGPLFPGLFDFDHGHTMNGGFLVDFSRHAGQGAAAPIGVQEEGAEFFVSGGLVVHGQQAAVDGRQRGLAGFVQAKPLHAVMVVTGAVFIIGVGAVVLVGGCASGQGVAQGVKHAGGVAGGYDHGVSQALGNRLEAQLARSSRCRLCGNGLTTDGQSGTAQHHGAQAAHAAKQHAAAAQARLQHRVKARVAAGVGVFVIKVDLFGHYGVPGCFVANTEACLG